MYRLVQTKLACTREPRNEANKSLEYGEVFRCSQLIILFKTMLGAGEGEGIVPHPLERMHIRVHGIRVYRKSSFVFVVRGKKLMSAPYVFGG